MHAKSCVENVSKYKQLCCIMPDQLGSLYISHFISFHDYSVLKLLQLRRSVLTISTTEMIHSSMTHFTGLQCQKPKQEKCRCLVHT